MEVETLEKNFNSIDTNSDKVLSKKEFSQALGMMPNDTYVSYRLFEAIDVDKDDHITFNEFMKTMAILLHGTIEERLECKIEN